MQRITPADLQRVAREYLSPKTASLYALLPNRRFKRSLPSPRATPSTRSRNSPLPNGLKLLVKEDHRPPFVEFRAVFQGGVLAEDPVNNGITQFALAPRHQGTQTRSAEQIAREIELSAAVSTATAATTILV